MSIDEKAFEHAWDTLMLCDKVGKTALRQTVETYLAARQPEASQQPVSGTQEPGDYAPAFVSFLTRRFAYSPAKAQAKLSELERFLERLPDAGDAGSELARADLPSETSALTMPGGSNPRTSRAPTEEVNETSALRRAKGFEMASSAPATDQPDEKPHPEGICQDCGRKNPVWFAPNALWNHVMGGIEAKGDPGGIICPVCFILRAEAAAVQNTGWELRPEAPKREMGTAQVDDAGNVTIVKNGCQPLTLTDEDKAEAVEAMISAAQSRGYDGKGMSSALAALLERFYVGRRP